MKKMFASALIVFALLAGLPRAFAIGHLILVTKENQASLGVKFTLTALKVSDTAVSVDMEIPKQSKLKDLKKVTMDIGDYKAGVATSPMVLVNLETKPGKDGSIMVSFQLSPEMVDKCSILLGPVEPAPPGSYAVYSVYVKSYVTTKK
jgi:hypothetical protein